MPTQRLLTAVKARPEARGSRLPTVILPYPFTGCRLVPGRLPMSREQQEALDRGINLFNEQRFFEAHEEWEQEWRLMREGDDKTFFQGLILAAGAFIHYTRHECSGAKELLGRSLSSLRVGMDLHPDIGVGQLIDDLTRLLEPFASCTFELKERDLPMIRRNLVNW